METAFYLYTIFVMLVCVASGSVSLSAYREAMKLESVRARSQHRADEAEAGFEQRKLERKQKHRGH